MTSVHCLFHDYSDYECSAETLISVYLTHGDAETGLLELIARAEKLVAKDQEFNQRFRACHERNNKVRPNWNREGQKIEDAWQKQYESDLQVIVDEQREWRLKEFGVEWGDMDTNIDHYHIDEVEIGVIR